MNDFRLEDVEFEALMTVVAASSSFDRWILNRALAHKAWIRKWQKEKPEPKWWEELVR